MKTINRIIKKAARLITCVVIGVGLALAAPSVHAQASVGTAGTGSSYTANWLPFYSNSVPGTTIIGSSTAFAGTSGTNINVTAGWTNTTIFTNSSGPLYTNNLNGTGSGGFYTNTTYVTNNQIIFPVIYYPKQSRVAMEWMGNCSGSPTNLILTFARSVTGRNGLADTTTQFTWSIPVGSYSAGKFVTAVTNTAADFTGEFGYLYLVGELWQSTNGSILTNQDGGLYYALKPASNH